MEIFNNEIVSCSAFLKCIELDKNIICYDCLKDIFKNYYHKFEISNILDEIRLEEKPKYRKKPISTKIIKQVFKKYGFKCMKCGSEEKLQIDHIKSEYCGGKTEIDNLQVLCKFCNQSKGIKDIDYRKQ